VRSLTVRPVTRIRSFRSECPTWTAARAANERDRIDPLLAWSFGLLRSRNTMYSSGQLDGCTLGVRKSMTAAGRPRLESWKEIARYLQASVRTVQLWERERNLPVHRLPGGKRSRVFAFGDEIEAWLRQASSDSLPETPRGDAPRTRASAPSPTAGMDLLVLALASLLSVTSQVADLI